MTGIVDLARACGVETSYIDLEGRRRRASPEALAAVLAALGHPVESARDAEDALWERERENHLRLLDPVVVSWEGDDRRVPVRLGRGERGQRVECRLVTETGYTVEWAGAGEVVLPDDVPIGYHDLAVRSGGRRGDARLIRAPRTVHDPAGREWGVFLPLYALRTRRSWGVGDLTDLGALARWVEGLGGGSVATLPLFAAFLDRPFDPSPYAPVSRLFFSELWVDPTRAPELAASEEARALVGSDRLRLRIRDLQRAPLVDYRAAAAVKREVLEALARTFFTGDGWCSDGFHRFLADHPEARDYARFRAVCETRPGGWRAWPGRMRDGEIATGEYPEPAARYHLYAQYLARRQMDELSADAALALDLPLGVHPDGFDAWRFRDEFVEGVSLGAPPDGFFTGGQDWGVPPPHPERSRATGHRTLIGALRTLCRHAATVRIDHVMAFHRLFWIPRGFDATEGVYVRYPAEELWAVVCVESSRSGTAIVGEDLGTVPPEVREAIDRHRARRTWVLPFQLDEADRRLEPPPERSVALLDTHDTPPFAAWWASVPPARRRTWREALAAAGAAPGGEPGELPESERPRPLLEAALRFVSDSAARSIHVNMEDLWLETEPQNVPGTSMDEKPNWRRKARFAMEIFQEMPEVVETLREVDARRRGKARA